MRLQLTMQASSVKRRDLSCREAAQFNQITAANAGERLGFAGKSRVGLSPRPGVAELGRWACITACLEKPRL